MGTGHQHGSDEAPATDTDAADGHEGHGDHRGSGAMQVMDERPAYRAELNAITTPEKRQELERVYDAYLDLQQAMVLQDSDQAKERFAALRQAVKQVNTRAFVGDSLTLWLELKAELEMAARHAAEAESDTALQRAFKRASLAAIDLEERFGHAGDVAYVQAHCSMALHNEGASWLQRSGDKTNPYFGNVMLGCVNIEQRHAPLPSDVHGERPEQLVEPPKAPDAVLEAIQPVYDSYLQTQRALADDDVDAAKAGFGTLAEAVSGVATDDWSQNLATDWERIHEPLQEAARDGAKAEDMEKARRAFWRVSDQILAMERVYGHAGAVVYYRHHCPMAFDNTGAPWLSDSDDIRNPYFGDQMLTCGDAPLPLPGQDR
jgi:Cu(I)/Ag(I) efflux system membrane fusion protein